MVQESGVLWTSVDGGRTWTRGAIQVPAGLRGVRLRSASPGELYAVGERMPGLVAGVLLRSEDHGSTWQRIPLPALPPP